MAAFEYSVLGFFIFNENPTFYLLRKELFEYAGLHANNDNSNRTIPYMNCYKNIQGLQI